MRIYPVLDIQNGIVVHGVRGERKRYRPLESRIVDSAEPLAVARAVRARCGLDTIYVADLDALGGAGPAEGVLTDLARDGFRLMVDAGVRSASEAAGLLRFGVEDVIVALETLPDMDRLREVVAAIGAPRTIFSLDLRNGVPITAHTEWSVRSGEDIALAAREAGTRRMVVLDLTSVGSNEGPAQQELLRTLRRSLPDVELITGGGVRSEDDIETFRSLGIDGVLVATALHRGTLDVRRALA